MLAPRSLHPSGHLRCASLPTPKALGCARNLKFSGSAWRPGSHRQQIQVARLPGNAEVLLGNAGSIGQRGHWRSRPFSSHGRNGHAPLPKKMILLSMILPIFLPPRPALIETPLQCGRRSSLKIEFAIKFSIRRVPATLCEPLRTLKNLAHRRAFPTCSPRLFLA